MDRTLRVEIKRSEWLRGGGNSVLLDGAGKKCCVGFACLTAGLTEDKIRHSVRVDDLAAINYSGDDLPSIAGLARPVQAGTSDWFYVEKGITNKLYEINDDISMVESDREKVITNLGRLAGIEFSFTD